MRQEANEGMSSQSYIGRVFTYYGVWLRELDKDRFNKMRQTIEEKKPYIGNTELSEYLNSIDPLTVNRQFGGNKEDVVSIIIKHNRKDLLEIWLKKKEVEVTAEHLKIAQELNNNDIYEMLPKKVSLENHTTANNQSDQTNLNNTQIINNNFKLDGDVTPLNVSQQLAQLGASFGTPAKTDENFNSTSMSSSSADMKEDELITIIKHKSKDMLNEWLKKGKVEITNKHLEIACQNIEDDIYTILLENFNFENYNSTTALTYYFNLAYSSRWPQLIDEILASEEFKSEDDQLLKEVMDTQLNGEGLVHILTDKAPFAFGGGGQNILEQFSTFGASFGIPAARSGEYPLHIAIKRENEIDAVDQIGLINYVAKQDYNVLICQDNLGKLPLEYASESYVKSLSHSQLERKYNELMQEVERG